MSFEPSHKTTSLLAQLRAFMHEVVYPNETTFADQVRTSSNRWASPAVMETMKSQALAAGLWNLFMPESEHGAGLTNVEYAPLCEEMGRSPIAPEVFNCAAPDTGNIESWFGTAPAINRQSGSRPCSLDAFGRRTP